MDVGNDPFPREEVTGLAAFENLEPVSSFSVLPPEPEPTPEPRGQSRSPATRTFTGTPNPVPYGEPDHPFSPPPDRSDATLPLDLSRETPLETDADHLFDSSSPGWDDPNEATRVATPSFVSSQATSLEMEWDDDEPPTQMRPEAMLDVPRLGTPIDWDDAAPATQIYTDQPPPQFGSGRHSATATLSGGRPSPFPTAPQFDESRFRSSSSRALGAPSPFASTARSAPAPQSFLDALRAGDRRAWLWAGSTAVGLLVLAAILKAVGGPPPVSAVTLVTKPADARVTIDGHAAAGTSSPYSVADLAPGKHELVVQKQGFAEYHGSFALAKGETKALPEIDLAPSVREIGFSIRSAPPGAEVWVDGKATDQLTPARVTGIAPGIHRLQLKKAGFADFDLQMFVPDATVLQLPTAELAEQAEAAAEPARASAEKSVASSQPAHESAHSHASHSWHSGGTLHASHARPEFAARPAQGMMAPPMAAAAMPGAGGRMGTLRINTRPWAQVIVDGRLVGNTPQPALQLPAGRHKLQLLNQPMGLSKTLTVDIKAGQIKTEVLNLAQ